MKTNFSKLPMLSHRLLQRTPKSSDVVRVSELMDAILEDAVAHRATDIHLDPEAGAYCVRFRIDGRLMVAAVLETDQGKAVLRAFKGQASMEPGFALLPQDGRTECEVHGRKFSLRIATAPSILGEKLAIRFFPQEATLVPLQGLGFSPTDYQTVSQALRDFTGMVLVTGPTGAGKTTTLYAMVQELRCTDRAIISIEDPVECILDGVTQLQVSQKQGLTFAEGLKGLLRLDPDVIVMGEMRDRESARAALDAADSGHLFLSTLHARDAAGTITALRNFGLADHEIAATLSMVVAQRLVRRLCANCRRKNPVTPREAEWLRAHHQRVPEMTWQPVGCGECMQTGYRGRVGIFEVWRLREPDLDRIIAHSDEHSLRQHLRKSTLSLLEDDLLKVEEGLTTVAEFETAGGCTVPAAVGRGKGPGEERHPVLLPDAR